jgi:hypothetical protein
MLTLRIIVSLGAFFATFVVFTADGKTASKVQINIK